MTQKALTLGLALTIGLGSAPAFSQAPSKAPGHDMGSMDMQATMNQCAQMREQMRPGAKMTAAMQGMMTQCDQMDAQMNGASSAPSGPREKTR